MWQFLAVRSAVLATALLLVQRSFKNVASSLVWICVPCVWPALLSRSSSKINVVYFWCVDWSYSNAKPSCDTISQKNCTAICHLQLVARPARRFLKHLQIWWCWACISGHCTFNTYLATVCKLCVSCFNVLTTRLVTSCRGMYAYCPSCAVMTS